MTKYTILFVSLFSVALNANPQLPKQSDTSHSTITKNIQEEAAAAIALGAIAYAGTKVQNIARHVQKLPLAAKVGTITIATASAACAYVLCKKSSVRSQK